MFLSLYLLALGITELNKILADFYLQTWIYSDHPTQFLHPLLVVDFNSIWICNHYLKIFFICIKVIKNRFSPSHFKV